MVSVSTFEELKEALELAAANNLETLFLGGGSNLLVSDDGVAKLVIQNKLSGIKQRGTILTAKSGTSLQELVNYSIEHGVAGLQKLTGIPGTVGGAIFGNAGAYGQSISDHLVEVVFFDGDEKVAFNKKQSEFSYRSSIFKTSRLPILEATFQFEEGETQVLKEEADKTLSQRLVKYPAGIKCPGSFFKNLIVAELPKGVAANIPEDKITFGKITAGYLLEEVGAKGLSRGDIEIAPYHANLFINKGKGTAKDFYELAQEVALKVKEKFGITLEPEVQLINLPPLI